MGAGSGGLVVAAQVQLLTGGRQRQLLDRTGKATERRGRGKTNGFIICLESNIFKEATNDYQHRQFFYSPISYLIYLCLPRHPWTRGKHLTRRQHLMRRSLWRNNSIFLHLFQFSWRSPLFLFFTLLGFGILDGKNRSKLIR